MKKKYNFVRIKIKDLTIKKTILDLKKQKENKEKITMVTAYDYLSAKLLDKAGIDMILVGDSLGMVVLGYEDTLAVRMKDMIYHSRAVSKGAKNAIVVADLPFMSYQASIKDAVRNSGRLLKEGRANAVKLEGGANFKEHIKAIANAFIPVMVHLGLTPQAVYALGGYKVQGKDEILAKQLIKEAKMAEDLGAFALLLECVPYALAKLISKEVKIPTIGIGAGKYCDGQVLVWHDLLGLNTDFKPKFAKTYANPLEAIKTYINEVKEGEFPGEEHSFAMDEEILRKLY